MRTKKPKTPMRTKYMVIVRNYDGEVTTERILTEYAWKAFTGELDDLKRQGFKLKEENGEDRFTVSVYFKDGELSGTHILRESEINW